MTTENDDDKVYVDEASLDPNHNVVTLGLETDSDYSLLPGTQFRIVAEATPTGMLELTLRVENGTDRIAVALDTCFNPSHLKHLNVMANVASMVDPESVARVLESIISKRTKVGLYLSARGGAEVIVTSNGYTGGGYFPKKAIERFAVLI